MINYQRNSSKIWIPCKFFGKSLNSIKEFGILSNGEHKLGWSTGLYWGIQNIQEVVLIQGFEMSQNYFKMIITTGKHIPKICIRKCKITLTHKLKFWTSEEFRTEHLDLSGTLVKDDFDYIDEYGWKLLFKTFSKSNILENLKYLKIDPSLYPIEDISKITSRYSESLIII